MDKNKCPILGIADKTPEKTQKLTSEHNALNFIFRRNILLAYFLDEYIYISSKWFSVFYVSILYLQNDLQKTPKKRRFFYMFNL